MVSTNLEEDCHSKFYLKISFHHQMAFFNRSPSGAFNAGGIWEKHHRIQRR